MKTLRTCIISQGNEILNGHILNSNSQWLSAFFVGSQYEIIEHVTVGDDMFQLQKTFERCIHEYDVLISTGGLGPTEDDLTSKVISMVTELRLEEHPIAFQNLHEYCIRRNRPLTVQMKQMAFLPKNSTCIPNPIGSASGYQLLFQETEIFVFPGVPTEMKMMIEDHFSQKRVFVHKPLICATFGLPESQLQQRLQPISDTYKIHISYHATAKANWITLFPHHDIKDDIQKQISVLLADCLYDISQNKKNTLVDVVANLLLEKGEMVATAESCTAGKLSAWLTSRSGSSQYFKEGVVVYSNEAKSKYCGVDPKLIQEQGAVCKQVANDLAKGIAKSANCTWGIGITGIAGPTGGSKEKPVGTVHISVFGYQQDTHKHCLFHGTRDQITDKACAQALFLLYQCLIQNNAL